MKGQNICTNCVMDTTDPNIAFDEKGVCNHCRKAERLLSKVRISEEESKQRLRTISERMKKKSRGRDYDCIIGLSGGVDSSYTAYSAHQLGLRTLAVHFDNGWNTEIAVSNIKNIVRNLNFDLETYVINWEEFRDLQRAFLRASVVDIEMLTDHAIMAAMFTMARRHKIRYVLSGQNHATENGMPKAWLWRKQDLINIKAIHRRYGEKPLKSFPTLSSWRWLILRRYVYQYVELLNSVNYKKFEAMRILKEKLGWQDYGGKHCESLFTKFYQRYILPEKFGFDKRRAHLSALIRNGEMTRDAALEELKNPPYEPGELREDKDYVLKKLGFTEEEFDALMKKDPVPHVFYPSDQWILSSLLAVYQAFKRLGLVKARGALD